MLSEGWVNSKVFDRVANIHQLVARDEVVLLSRHGMGCCIEKSQQTLIQPCLPKDDADLCQVEEDSSVTLKFPYHFDLVAINIDLRQTKQSQAPRNFSMYSHGSRCLITKGHLIGQSNNYFVPKQGFKLRCNEIKFEVFGRVNRIQVFGIVEQPPLTPIDGPPTSLLGTSLCSRVFSSSPTHYGHPSNVLLHSHEDGTTWLPDPDIENPCITLELCHTSFIKAILIDTTGVANVAKEIKVKGRYKHGNWHRLNWVAVNPNSKLAVENLHCAKRMTQVSIRMTGNGGLNRIKVMGWFVMSPIVYPTHLAYKHNLKPNQCIPRQSPSLIKDSSHSDCETMSLLDYPQTTSSCSPVASDDSWSQATHHPNMASLDTIFDDPFHVNSYLYPSFGSTCCQRTHPCFWNSTPFLLNPSLTYDTLFTPAEYEFLFQPTKHS
ncbi:hypothetical protein DSO57_1005541 [Entomophthora muscae]|uniref:Uncharacterized protein n=1 Tax=Entomophthora muscae TaxID=34485 RepID=A0ACC2TIQ9_9FUNG|nr:hypothetical protein DSO57_1005541 [Entomophthora muscae]